MSASPKVVSLLRGKPKAAEATLHLVETLRTQVVETLHERLDIMFDGADDLLFEFAERAGNNEDRRLFFDTMRAVRLGRRSMISLFSERFLASFGAPVAASVVPPGARITEEQLSLQKNESVELDIAVSNMASKAEGLYKTTLWDISGRLKALVEDYHAPMSAEAVSPLAICRAFRASAETLKVDFDVELVVFKLFDRLVISELGDLYFKVLNFLKQHGVQSTHASYSPSNRPGGALGADSAGQVSEAISGPRFGSSPPRSFANAPLSVHSAPQQEFRAPVGLAASMMMSPTLDSQSLASLQRIADRRFATLWPTHGPPVTDVPPFIDAYIAHRLEREAGVLAAVQGGVDRIPAIVEKLYVGLDPKLKPAAAQSVYSHLIKLVAEGRVRSEGPALLSSRYLP